MQRRDLLDDGAALESVRRTCAEGYRQASNERRRGEVSGLLQRGRRIRNARAVRQPETNEPPKCKSDEGCTLTMRSVCRT